MRCALCPNVNKCLPEDGRGDVLFIGEAPGAQENKRGTVFTGKTGDEVNRHYLPLAGLRRDTVRFTNAIRCLPVSTGGKLDPKRAQDTALLQSCTNTFLYPSIEAQPPRLIVPMGAFACRAIFGEGFDLELEHGIPQESKWGMAYPMFHPALGIYEPKRMLLLRNDWIRLRRYLGGKLVLPEDPYPNPDYREVTDAKELAELDPTLPLGCDTESTKEREPYCLTYSQKAGTGRLIRTQRVDLLIQFQRHLDRWEAPLLWHNWFYDWGVTERMGLQFPHHRVVDTMAEVYRLGNLPQGLKALSRRELGMQMQDFEDLVEPHSRELVLDYFRRAQAVEWPKPEPDLIQDSLGQWKVYKAQSLNTKLKRFFTDVGKDLDKDVFKTWDNWKDSQVQIEAEVGPFPGMCISHVPFHDTLFYACRDADALIRLYPILKKMQARVRKFPQDRWRE